MVDVIDWVGQEIAGGRYQILERIGVGSMGLVYRAHDRHLSTEVVIKCPVREEADRVMPAFLERFELEIRSLVHLSHPHIVKIIDVGVARGLPLRGHAVPLGREPEGPHGDRPRRASSGRWNSPRSGTG